MGFAANVYADQLAPRAHGLPLWEPEPTKEGEVLIGDVGYIYDGGFYRLFNVTFPEDDPVNAKGVPDDFVQLKYNHRLHAVRDPYIDAGPLCSRSVQSFSVGGGGGADSSELAYRFKCTKEQGALLVLKDDARKEAIHPNRTFVEYMRTHHEHWYEFSLKIGLEIPREDVILVRGWVKTSEWAVAAFIERGQAHEVSFHGQFGQVAQAGFSVAVSESSAMSVETRSGPRPRTTRPPQPPSRTGKNVEVEPGNRSDQCVFLSCYKIKYRTFLPNKITAAAGSHNLPDAQDDVPPGSSSPEVVYHPMPAKEFQDPLDDVLDYILAHSDAERAITSDGDIHELCNGEEWPDNLASFLREHAPRIDVEDGTGMLSLEEAITRARRDDVEDDLDINTVQDLMLYEDAQPATEDTQMAEASPKISEPVDQPEVEGPQETRGLQQVGEPQEAGIQQEGPTPPESGPEGSADAGANVEGSQDAQPGPSNQPSSLAPYKAPENLRGGAILLRRNLQEARVFEWPHRVLLDNNAECGAVCSTAISPDGQHVASGFEDCMVRIWNLETGQLEHVLEGHRDNVWGTSYSADGRWIATGSADNTAIVWNAQSGQLVRRLEGHEADIWTAVFSPDGTRLATGSVDCKAKLWDTRTGGCAATLGGHNAVVLSLAFTPDSTRLITAADERLHIWDGKNGLELMTLRGHGGVIWCMDISPDGRRVVTGSEDHTCRVWSVENGEELVTIREHSGPVWGVKFSPDGQNICSGSYDSTVAVTSTYSGTRQYQFHQRPSIVNDVAYTSDGDFIAAGCADGGVRVWDATNGQFLAEVQGHLDKAKSVIFANDGDSLVSSSDDGTVRVWSLLDMLRL